MVEYGERGELALARTGPDAADVVYDGYADLALRGRAIEALAEHGTMALTMLDKYATDPDFRDILRTYGAAVIPPIAQTDAGPETLAYLRSKPKRSFTESLAKSILFLSGENGQATIRTIKASGLERVAELNSTELKFYQFLPLYDLLHLGSVLSRGHAPTSGEMTWALIDGCFVVVDALSLAAIQPEGMAAAEATRAEIKAATREGIKAVGGALAEEGTEAATRALARQGAAQGGEATTERLALVGRPARRRDLSGAPPRPRGPAAPQPLRGRQPRPIALCQGWVPPEHLGTGPAPQERPGSPDPHPPRARSEISGRAGRAGRRGRGRLPEDGGTPGLAPAPASLIGSGGIGRISENLPTSLGFLQYHPRKYESSPWLDAPRTHRYVSPPDSPLPVTDGGPPGQGGPARRACPAGSGACGQALVVG